MDISTLPPPTRVGANGIRCWTAGTRPDAPQEDVYEIPDGVDGVAHTFSVRHRPWWRGGDVATARDADGHALSVRRDGHTFIAEDPQTRLSTKLDVESLDLTVSAPVHSRQWSQGRTNYTEETCPLQEEWKGSGEVTVRTGFQHTEAWFVAVPPKDPSAATVQQTLRREEYDETQLTSWQVKTWHVKAGMASEPVERTEVTSHVDQSGELVIKREDGREESYRLFVPPHGSAAQG